MARSVAAEVGFTQGWPEPLQNHVELLAQQLKEGLPKSALELAPLYQRGLNRTTLLNLSDAGLRSVGKVEKLSHRELLKILNRAQVGLLYKKDQVEYELAPVASYAEETTISDDLPQNDAIHLGGPRGLSLSRSRPDQLIFR